MKTEKEALLNQTSIDFLAGKTYCILSKNRFEKAGLLAVIAGYTDCTSGTVEFENQPLKKITKEDYRGKQVGLILQKNNFLPYFSIIENLQLCSNSLQSKRKPKSELYKLLKSVGIEQKLAGTQIKKLSNINQQKACLVKAIVNNPKVILVEEPLLTLSEIPLEVSFEYLKDYAENQNSCVIILSKSNFVAKYADEIWGLNGGKLSFIK
ncbi:ATP-binding cassette domain-containing protein [Enterococcus rivorum]|nr:ATP-binding cassette domain-containing protein [Enterococcus rivorum]